ncbi:MAG: GNAT family N-acetyltransferase [Syntrophaceae bacterium]|nr:GNAT family N-acetyltransferase [Syntrophaceae bacterium]
MFLKSMELSNGDILDLYEMTSNDIKPAVLLIADIMDDGEAEYAHITMRHHFNCKMLSLHDGREYYTLKNRGNHLLGLLGLHHYEWGPHENVWLAWFGICQELRGQGIGKNLINFAEEFAYDRGYRKLFIETYSGPVFKDARVFYEKSGFRQAGTIANYMPNGDDMLIYYKKLGKDILVNA